MKKVLLAVLLFTAIGVFNVKAQGFSGEMSFASEVFRVGEGNRIMLSSPFDGGEMYYGAVRLVLCNSSGGVLNEIGFEQGSGTFAFDWTPIVTGPFILRAIYEDQNIVGTIEREINVNASSGGGQTGNPYVLITSPTLGSIFRDNPSSINITWEYTNISNPLCTVRIQQLNGGNYSKEITDLSGTNYVWSDYLNVGTYQISVSFGNGISGGGDVIYIDIE